jgi:hypothetical protein
VLAQLSIWAAKHQILASLLGLHTPQWAIINLASEAGAAAAGFWVMAGVGALNSFLQTGGGRRGGGGQQKKAKEQKSTSDSCPPEKRRFFNWLDGPLGQMAKDLNTTKTLMLTMAVKEAGWTARDLDHNEPLNNPFGVNRINNRGQAAGNIKYSSLDEATRYWKQRFGDRVRGAQSVDDFLKGLQHPTQGQPYNSADPNTTTRL